MRPAIEELKSIYGNTPLIGAEVGVYEGEHAVEILSRLNIKHLYLIDPYLEYDGWDDGWKNGIAEKLAIAERNVSQFKDKITFIKEKFEEFDTKILPLLDFVYIDGNHASEFVKKDIELALKLTKDKAFICGHDYHLQTVKSGVDSAVLNTKYKLYSKDSDWWFRKESNESENGMKVFYFNLNVGSGIERIGDNIKSMLEDFEVFEYKMQNPAYLMMDDMVRENPDAIVMNEYFPRVVEAAAFFKKFKPSVKIVLINHCYPTIEELTKYNPQNDIQGNPDRQVVIRDFIVNRIDQIINLSWHPKESPYPAEVRNKTTDMYVPVNKKFNFTTPFSQRPNDFFYMGNLFPHKISPEFATKFSNTNMKMDMWCKKPDAETLQSRLGEAGMKEYVDSFSPNNFVFKGFCPEEKLVETMNSYKFFVVPHRGYEPLLTILSEVIVCGAIPLIVNTRDYRFCEWTDYAKGFYYEYKSVDTLIDAMKGMVEGRYPTDDMDKVSSMISQDFQKRNNYDRFKEVLKGFITANRPAGPPVQTEVKKNNVKWSDMP